MIMEVTVVPSADFDTWSRAAGWQSPVRGRRGSKGVCLCLQHVSASCDMKEGEKTRGEGEEEERGEGEEEERREEEER